MDAFYFMLPFWLITIALLMHNEPSSSPASLVPLPVVLGSLFYVDTHIHADYHPILQFDSGCPLSLTRQPFHETLHYGLYEGPHRHARKVEVRRFCLGMSVPKPNNTMLCFRRFCLGMSVPNQTIPCSAFEVITSKQASTFSPPVRTPRTPNILVHEAVDVTKPAWVAEIQQRI